MTTMQSLSERIEGVHKDYQTALAAHDAGSEKRRKFAATGLKLRAERQRLSEKSEAQAIAGAVPDGIEAIERLSGEIRFVEKAAARYEAYEFRDLVVRLAETALELSRALYAGEEARLKQHESQLVQAIQGLQKITGNVNFSIGGGASEVAARKNADFVGDRLTQLVRYALADVRLKEAALANERARTIEMRREYLTRHPA